MHSKLSNMRVLLAAAIATFGLVPSVHGHTWVEQLRNINDKGQYVGDYGYPRGMVAKTDPGYNGDTSMLWLLPQADEKTLPWIGEDSVLCHPKQRKPEQSKASYPRLKTAPGQFIAMRYTENGHVSLINDDTNKPKPEKGGTVFIYGTTEPKEDEKLVNVLRWTQDGQGGDKGGVLLATNNYDDNRCYERNALEISQERQKADPNFMAGQVSDGPGNADLRCESNVALPKDAEPGKPYTFYWVWQWNTAPGKDPKIPGGKDEYYTTCIDVDVVDTAVKAQDASAAKFALPQQQDAMSVAVTDWASRTALYTDAIKGEIGPVFSDGQTASGAPPASATAPASEVTPPASKPTAPASKPTGPAQSTLATVPKPSSGNGSAPTGIPTMTDRPGRKQPDTTSAPGRGNGNGNGHGHGNDQNDPVTVTDTVLITVTGRADSPRATHIARLMDRKIPSKFTA